MSVRAALYLRVSNGDRQTTDNQRPELEELAEARGFRVVQIYEEHQSAAKRRPQYEAMLSDAKRRRFDVLLVWALDRFGRTMVRNLSDVLELDRVGVQVVSVRETWLDTGGPVRSLLVAIFSWVAEQERTQLIARTKAGLATARRKGKRLGRPRAERRHADQRGPRLDVDVARAILATGVSCREAARQIGASEATLRRALARAPASETSPADDPATSQIPRVP
jgi:putative DNA-invertase from lambdoid prophage Rac